MNDAQQAFSLTRLIDRFVGRLDLDTPEQIIEQVMAALPRADYERALREALRDVVPSRINRVRNRMMPSIRKVRSKKQALIRDEWWPRFLEQLVLVAGDYKRLADCTSDDLRAVAQARRVKADELHRRADQFDALADIIDASGAAVLGDLSSAPSLPLLELAS